MKKNKKNKDFEKLAALDPSTKYLAKQHRLGEKLIFITYEGRIEGVIEEILKYELRLKGRGELLPKLDILFLYKPDASGTVDRILETDGEVAEENLEPIRSPRKRLKIPTDQLHNSWKGRRDVEITLRNGQVLRGKIHSFGIFSIRLELARDSRVVIMKPNIYALNHSPEEKPAETAEVYRGNVKTKIFHSAGCRYFGCDDCTAVFGSPEEAVKAGFRPHKQCNGG